jgi:hypothetical protein
VAAATSASEFIIFGDAQMKSQIYSAYVAGLCPLQVLMEMGKHEPDSHRKSRSAPTCDEASTDLPRMPPPRKRALLLIGLAIGAWQLLARTEEKRAAAVVSAQDSASGKSVLLFVLIVGLTIGAGELLSHADKGRAADVPAKESASANSILSA